MQQQFGWLEKNRTLVTAALATAILVTAVFMHWLQPGRCVIALVFCWALAAHSQDINDHKTEVATALQEVARAGLEYRTGQLSACGEDLQAAGKIAGDVYQEARAEKAAGEQAAGEHAG